MGHFHSYPVLFVLWRPERLAQQPGVRYFTRLTALYTGKRPAHYSRLGTYYPQTATWDLWSHIG